MNMSFEQGTKIIELLTVISWCMMIITAFVGGAIIGWVI